MDLYFLIARDGCSGLTEMERELVENICIFNDCVFDETALARLTELIQERQDELMMEHQGWKAVAVRLYKGQDRSLWIAIGQYHVLCARIRRFYTKLASKRIYPNEKVAP